ncbi:outer membrane lipoprotein carrier protein LolA [Sphingosinicella sp. CPCC 101087]|uniref:LolA family protein n=1 Tax=Sphingosinicella sp. CPCC 101087 TaxID=2497754 RepID=UPI00101B9C99|nr:outer membrane lipoprotein carrier protein LolA [Sphingosinicella sp. CPCC 101087]
MPRISALALAAVAAPLTMTLFAPAPVVAQADRGLAQVQAHLRAVDTMTARFTQTDRRGRTLSGTLSMKRPGKVRFDYGRNANMLIVGDGRALTFVDYEVGQRQRWPINDSPLSVLLDPNQDLARFSRVIRNDDQVLLLEARDPRRREFGKITIAFVKAPGAPAGLTLQGWNVVDAQNNLTSIRLSAQRFNVPVADNLFTYRDPRRAGPRG